MRGEYLICIKDCRAKGQIDEVPRESSLGNLDTLPHAKEVLGWMEGLGVKRRLVGISPERVIVYVWPDTVELMEHGRNKVIAGVDSVFASLRNGDKSQLHKGGLGVVY